MRQNVSFVRSFESLGLNKIEKLLALGRSVKLQRPSWLLMTVAVKRLASFHLLLESVCRHIAVLPYLGTCVWSRIENPAFRNVQWGCENFQWHC